MKLSSSAMRLYATVMTLLARSTDNDIGRKLAIVLKNGKDQTCMAITKLEYFLDGCTLPSTRITNVKLVP